MGREQKLCSIGRDSAATGLYDCPCSYTNDSAHLPGIT
jgi:hypothetical protein